MKTQRKKIYEMVDITGNFSTKTRNLQQKPTLFNFLNFSLKVCEFLFVTNSVQKKIGRSTQTKNPFLQFIFEKTIS